MEAMTPRERIMTAMRNKQPDRVPVAPDISNMVPCKLTRKPFWEIYKNQNPPLWKAYIDAAKYFGIDGWFIDDGVRFITNSQVQIERKVVKCDFDCWEIREMYHTPDGDLTCLTVFPKDNPPSIKEKLIKDFEADFKKIRHLYPEITGYDDTLYKEMKKELGDSGVMGTYILPPGLHIFNDLFNGGLENATYAYYDYPELFEELCEMHEKFELKKLEILLDLDIDSILTGGSGSITMQSPDIWSKLALPTLKKIIRMCNEAGVISGVHSCGKERYLVETLANETNLNYINPLEIPPMGDCDLAQIKEKFGHKLALMGNLHTTSVMLYGTVDDVKRESLKAILDAGIGGGFILSTGDQCGRDTPDENIFAMIETVKEFGRYPLDIDKIENEIKRLEVAQKSV